MSAELQEDTIAAIATGKGAAGIGIVKLSGRNALSIAAKLFRPGRNGCQESGTLFSGQSHRLYHGWIRSAPGGEILDEVLVGVMRGPHSFTGEDVVEINSHGGGQCLSAILEAVLDGGARLAQPGEFTRRAWIHGRIDLTQAEAVAELIHARSAKALQFARKRLQGGMGKRLKEVRQKAGQLLAELEAGIEFGEEIDCRQDGKAVARILRSELIATLKQALCGYRQQRGYVEGVRVALVGAPNVGKSSLVNRLVCSERVLVSDFPGTTRDRVDVPMRLGDLPLVLCDTAGIDGSQALLDIASRRISIDCLIASDMVLFVLDAQRGADAEAEEIRRLLGQRPVILVFNKMDLVNGADDIQAPTDWPQWPVVKVSALRDANLGGLEAAIQQMAVGDAAGVDCDIVPNLRQYRLMQETLTALERGALALEESEGGESLAVCDLKEAMSCLDAALGRRIDDDVLDAIFAQFCIGK